MLNKLRTFIQQLTQQHPHAMQASGQGLVEYALILVLVSVVSVGVLSTMGNEIADVYEETACSLDSGEDCECRVIENVVTSEFSCTAGDLFAYTALTTCGTDTELSLLSESTSSSDEYAMSYNSTSNLFEMTNSTTICNELDSASPPQLYLVSRHTQDDGKRSFQLGANGAPTSGYGGSSSSASSGSGSGSGGTDTSGGSSGGTDTSGGSSGGTDTSGGSSGGTDTSGGSSGGTDTSGGSSGGTDTSGGSSSGTDTSGGSSGGTDTSGGSSGGTDTSGGSSSGTDTNNEPVMSVVGAQTVNEGSSKTLTFSATDADGDTLTFGTTSDLPSFMTFIASSNPPSLTIAPDYSDAGTYNVTVGVIDGNGGNDIVNFDVDVVNVNRKPVFDSISNQTVKEAESKTVTLSATDADGDDLTFGLSGTLPGFMTFNGSANPPVIQIAPGYDDAGTYSVSVYAVDDSGDSDTETFSIIVTNTNRDPFIADVTVLPMDEGATQTLAITASDVDHDTVTLTATDIKDFMTFTPADDSATLELKPLSGDSGTYTVTINADDGQGGTDSKQISVTVNAVATSIDMLVEVSASVDDNQQSSFIYRITNNSDVSLSNFSVRLYYTTENRNKGNKYTLDKYWDESGSASISGPTSFNRSTYYYTITYSGTLAAGSSWQFNGALHLSNWASKYSSDNDWWANGGLTSSFATTTTIPVFMDGELIYGNTP